MKTLSSDIGIIGGADGPTSIIVSTSDDFWIYAVITAVVIIAIIVSILRIKRRKK